MESMESPLVPINGRKVQRRVYGFPSRPIEASVLEMFPLHMNDHQLDEPQQSLFQNPVDEGTIIEDIEEEDEDEDEGDDPLIHDSTQMDVSTEIESPSDPVSPEEKFRKEEEEEHVLSRRRSRRVLDRISKQEELEERLDRILTETDTLFHKFTPEQRNSVTVRNVVQLLEESIQGALSKDEKKQVRQRLTELNTATVLLNQQVSATVDQGHPEDPGDVEEEPIFDPEDSDYEDGKRSKRKAITHGKDKNTVKRWKKEESSSSPPLSSEKRMKKKLNPRDFALSRDPPIQDDTAPKPVNKSKRMPAHLKIHLDMKKKREAKIREEEMARKNQEKEKMNEQDRLRAQLIARKFETDNDELRIHRTEERLNLLEKLEKRRWEVLHSVSLEVDCLDVPISSLPMQGPTHGSDEKLEEEPETTSPAVNEESHVSDEEEELELVYSKAAVPPTSGTGASAPISFPPKQISPKSVLDFFGITKQIKAQKQPNGHPKVKKMISRSALTTMLRKKQVQAGNEWLARELGHENQEDHIRQCINAMTDRRNQILKREEERRKMMSDRRQMMQQLLTEQENYRETEEDQAQQKRTLLSDGTILDMVEDEMIDDDEMALARKLAKEEEMGVDSDPEDASIDDDRTHEESTIQLSSEIVNQREREGIFEPHAADQFNGDNAMSLRNLSDHDDDERLIQDNTQNVFGADPEELVNDSKHDPLTVASNNFVADSTDIARDSKISNDNHVMTSEESNDIGEEREFDETEDASNDLKEKVKKNSVWKAMILKEAELARKQKKMRAVRDGLVEAEAEEEEEEDIAGLEDFGFTIGAKKKSDDDEEDNDDIDEEDFDNVVDDLSDNEGDEEAGDRARRAFDAQLEKERLKEIKRRVREGYDGRREGIAGGFASARGVHRFDQLVAAEGVDEAKRLGLQNDDELEDDLENGNEEKIGDGEIDDENELLDREIKQRHMKKDHFLETLVDDDDDDEESIEEDEGEENSNDEEDREQERLAKRFSKRARMNRIFDMQNGDSQFSRSRLLEEDVTLQRDLKAIKNAQSKNHRNVSVGSLFSSVMSSQSSFKRCETVSRQSNLGRPCDSKQPSVSVDAKCSTSGRKISLALRISNNTDRFKTTFLGRMNSVNSMSRSSSNASSSLRRICTNLAKNFEATMEERRFGFACSGDVTGKKTVGNALQSQINLVRISRCSYLGKTESSGQGDVVLSPVKTTALLLAFLCNITRACYSQGEPSLRPLYGNRSLTVFSGMKDALQFALSPLSSICKCKYPKMNFIRQLTQKSSSYYFKQFRGRGISRKHFRSFSSTLDQKDARNNTWTAGAILFTLTSTGFFLQHEPSPLLIPCTSLEESHSIDKDSNITLLNWSGTHQVDVSSQHYYEPTSEEEVISILSMCHENNWSVRPVGSALSPNGLSFQHQGMMSLSHLDSVLEIQQVSPESATVRVQAGAKVSHLLDTLRSHGWTLPNLASISEQQLGGFVQVSAHGTGATIPPVDDFVVAMTLITPSKGKIHLSLENNGDLFHLAKVGLGCLGIVTELTLKCIPAHKLVEHTFVLTREEAKAQICSLLQQHKHVRYMWIPYEDAVVVVTNDPEETLDQRKPEIQVDTKKVDVEERFQPFTDLIRQLKPVSVDEDPVLSNQGFGDLRDQLIAHDPLNETHIRRVNKAEAEFWRRSEGYQIKPSDQLLQFDCGGQQWVHEVCFPTGTFEENDGRDMGFMDALLKNIEERGIPAHAPIEQRWTSSSSSKMSPAFGPPGDLFSWVGIIMYLPISESDGIDQLRRDITNRFNGEYCDLLREIGKDPKYKAVSHWAKLEIPSTVNDLVELKKCIGNKYPLDDFNALRLEYDPKNILGNHWTHLIIGSPGSKDPWKSR